MYYLFFCLAFCLPVSLPVSFSVCLSVHPSIRLFLQLLLRLSVCLPVFLGQYLTVLTLQLKLWTNHQSWPIRALIRAAGIWPCFKRPAKEEPVRLSSVGRKVRYGRAGLIWSDPAISLGWLILVWYSPIWLVQSGLQKDGGCREAQGDAGRHKDTKGDTGRHKETKGDKGRQKETKGDTGRCREKAGRSREMHGDEM